jgi:hypothetical protein
MPKVKDITGQRFGRLVTLQITKSTKRRDIQWLCQCDCGRKHITYGYLLRSGKTKSCGCGRSGVPRHGHAKRGMMHPLYSRWAGMHDRCRNPNHKQFKDYGGRGIKVCERWNDFAKFLDDVGEPPTFKHTIGRIDNNGNYEPNNFRWETRKENNNNQRPRKRIDQFTTAEIEAELARRIHLN